MNKERVRLTMGRVLMILLGFVFAGAIWLALDSALFFMTVAEGESIRPMWLGGVAVVLLAWGILSLSLSCLAAWLCKRKRYIVVGLLMAILPVVVLSQVTRHICADRGITFSP